MNAQKSGRLDDESRRLLGKMVQNRIGSLSAAAKPEAPQSTPPPSTGATDFQNLPGYKELKLQRSMAALAGLDNPYFRLHEAAAGATTIIGGRKFTNFSSYDYLGLNQHPEVRRAAHEAIELYGQEDCAVFVSGHATNVSAIGAILGPKDLIVHETLAHNSILAGATLSRAERKFFPHNDLDALDALLSAHLGRFDRALIVVEGLYSMDGDIPDLPGLIEIKRRHNAWLMVDDAHGLGVLGARGYGLFEHFAADPRQVDIWMGTLSKTLAGCGGFVAGSTALVEYLKCFAGGFVYSVGLSPPLAAAARAALAVLHRESGRVERLHQISRYFYEAAKARGWDTGPSIGSAIIPLMAGNSVCAVALSQKLFEREINVQPIIHPAVPERAARLRFFLTSEHSTAQIDTALAAIEDAMQEIDSSPLLQKIPGFVKSGET